jgi:hypothetical protein
MAEIPLNQPKPHSLPSLEYFRSNNNLAPHIDTPYSWMAGTIVDMVEPWLDVERITAYLQQELLQDVRFWSAVVALAFGLVVASFRTLVLWWRNLILTYSTEAFPIQEPENRPSDCTSGRSVRWR